MANVLDRNGRPLQELTKDNFQVKVNGRLVTHVEATYSVAPRRIVVMLDISGSMGGDVGHNKWKIASEAVQDLLVDTPADVSLALVTFSDHVNDIFEFSQSRSSMARWLKEGATRWGDSRIHGGTALLDAVIAATKLFSPTRLGDSIYLISDAGDNHSQAHSKDVWEMLLRSEIRLFVFLLADPLHTDDARLGTAAIREMARATGGFVFGVPGYSPLMNGESWGFYDYDEHTRDKIAVYTRALNLQINGFYMLRFESPVAAGKPRKVSLDIVDSTGKAMKDVAYTYSTLLPQL